MNLHYDVSIPVNDQPLVLMRGEQERVEMHLRRDDEGLFALFAFAGTGLQPERTQQQGPYHSLDQALGARRAIAGALVRQGFEVSGAHEIWGLSAQRAIREVRRAHERYRASYKFDPKDVYLDW